MKFWSIIKWVGTVVILIVVAAAYLSQADTAHQPTSQGLPGIQLPGR